MTIGILKEPLPETRVSMLPDIAAAFIAKGIQVRIEKTAGNTAFAFDESYTSKGLQVVSRTEVLVQSDIILSMNLLSEADVNQVKTNASKATPFWVHSPANSSGGRSPRTDLSDQHLAIEASPRPAERRGGSTGLQIGGHG